MSSMSEKWIGKSDFITDPLGNFLEGERRFPEGEYMEAKLLPSACHVPFPLCELTLVFLSEPRVVEGPGGELWGTFPFPRVGGAPTEHYSDMIADPLQVRKRDSGRGGMVEQTFGLEQVDVTPIVTA